MVQINITHPHYPAAVSVLDWSGPVRDGLREVEARLRGVTEGEHEWLTSAIDQLLNAGGKRLRPVLCLLTAGLLDADYDRSIQLAAAIEMLHTATLVHDDMIDGALLRRGAPTLNADSSPKATILAGDYLFARAAHLAALVGNVEVMDAFAQTLMVMVNGEIDQHLSLWRANRHEYNQRIYAKTAVLFVLATRGPAILAGVSRKTMEAAIAFGRLLGTAFQIVDDVLDFVSTPKWLGKPTGSDLQSGLFTLPAILYYEAYPDDPDIKHLFAQKNGNKATAQHLIGKIQGSRFIDEALREARKTVSDAKSILNTFPDSIFKDSLRALADAAVERKT
jgi:geranylgeranyl pyrophosphate synthase